jgi:hypothetical protein
MKPPGLHLGVIYLWKGAGALQTFASWISTQHRHGSSITKNQIVQI